MRPRYFELLRTLVHHQVDFIVVGGVAAILEGAPITTLDLDVVFDRSGANVGRLAAAVRTLNARYRDPAGRIILPDEARLATTRTNLLATDLGPLDLMVEIGAGKTYPDLLPAAKSVTVGGLAVRVLGLAKVIETKEQAGRDKDLAMLPVLRRTLELKGG